MSRPRQPYRKWLPTAPAPKMQMRMGEGSFRKTRFVQFPRACPALQPPAEFLSQYVLLPLAFRLRLELSGRRECW
jgi:hypothetical protein